MTKHVRFASQHTLYSHLPPVPLRALSTGSLPPSHTPRAVQKTARSASAEPVLQHEPSLGKLRLHILLAFSPFMKPSMEYDLSLPPTTLTAPYAAHALLEPATNPPVSSLTITCPHLKWPIFVSFSPQSPFQAGSYVSVLDVLTTLHHTLRTAVHPAEYEALPTQDATQNVNTAYFNRCRHIFDPAARKTEALKGVKRVDFLMGRNRFLGLSGTSMDSNVWELNVSPWARD